MKEITCYLIGETSLLPECGIYLLKKCNKILGVFSEDPKVVLWAKNLAIPVHQELEIFEKELLNNNFDYLFSIANPIVIKDGVLKTPSKFSINYHNSLLPTYAGVHATSWAILNKEKIHGITWHIIEKKVDSGDTLVQKSFEIDKHDTAFNLNLKCYQLALEGFYELTDSLMSNSFKRLKQDLNKRSFFSLTKQLPNAGIIIWEAKAEEIECLSRAVQLGTLQANFLGSLRLFLGNTVFLIGRAADSFIKSINKPGTIVSYTKDHLQVATQTTDILISEIYKANGEELSVSNFLKITGFQQGKVFPIPQRDWVEKLSNAQKALKVSEKFWAKHLNRQERFASSLTPGNLRVSSIYLNNQFATKLKIDCLHNKIETTILALVWVYMLRCSEYSDPIPISYSNSNILQIAKDYESLISSSVPFAFPDTLPKIWEDIVFSLERQLENVAVNKTFLLDIFTRYPFLRDSRQKPPNDFIIGIIKNSSEINETITSGLFYSIDEHKLIHYRLSDSNYEHFCTSLSNFIINSLNVLSEKSLNPFDIPLLTKDEMYQVTCHWNRTEPFLTYDKTTHELFEEQVARTPDNIAVAFENVSLTYCQLNERANQLAHYLKSSGVKTEDLIGLSLRRSLDLVVGLLGILKAGAAYVPLDPSYPQERIAFMVKDSKVNFLVTESCFKELFAKCSARMIYVDAEKEISLAPITNLLSSSDPHNLAYVIYTSGSTGQPKGVMIPHSNVARLFSATHKWYQFGERDTWTLFHSYAFDFSVWEIWGALLYGGKLVVVPYLVSRSPKEFYNLLAKEKVTVLNQTPTAFQQIINYEDECQELKHLSLRYVIFGGEALNFEIIAPWFKRHGDTSQLVNMYGITETTVHVTHQPILSKMASNKTSMIGNRIPDLTLYCLNSSKQPVPIGVIGELYVGGEGLARGYLNRPELTEQRFIPNPFATEEDRLHGKNLRLYRTGDLVRYLPDGNLEYLGRCDEQVKIRGFRIELGEIEHVLRQSSIVKDCRVIAIEENNQKRLIAYVIALKKIEESEQKQINQTLQELVKQKLPDYMMPSAFMFIDNLPLNPNGKLDRKKLPLPSITQITIDSSYVAPQTSLQAKLVSMWEELLNVKPIGITHDFFKLGGHSLLAMRLIAMVRREFKVELSLRTLFEAPTVRALSDSLEKELNFPRKLYLPIERQIRGEKIPLSFGQQRLWFIEQLEPEKALYQVPIVLRFTGILNVDALNKALNSLIDRHEILRTYLAEDQGKPYQVIVPSNSVSIDFEIAGNTKLESHFNELIELPFNLTKGPLLRCNVTQLSSDQHVLTLVMHHVTTDGWSLGILAKELSALYNHYAYQAPLALKPLTIQYADYAIWQRGYLSENLLSIDLSYWKEQLVDVPEESIFPTDHPRPKVSSYQGARISATISSEQVAQLNQLAQTQSATLFMVLLASLKTLLYRYTNQEDLVIGTPIAGRTHQELEGLIGFFVNTIALRGKVKTEMSFVQFLSQVKHSILAAFAHQVISFEHVVEQVGVERHLGRHPLFQVMLVLQNNEPLAFNLQGLEVQPEPISYQNAKFDLTINACELPSGDLSIELEYAIDLYEAATIKQILQHWQVLLKEVCIQPQQSIGKLTLLTKEEQKLLLVDWNKMEAVYPQDKTIHQLFEEQVVRIPDNIAVVFENVFLTYRQLNERANQLAHYLRGLGVKTEDLVGLSINRSLDLIVGLLGILKAGAAYVPLDPSYPPERIIFMLEDSKVNLLVTESCFKEIFAKCSARTIYLDTEKEITKSAIWNPPNIADFHNLIYVIYTSGSTGQPKGVMITHCNVARLFSATHKWYQFGERDTWTLFHSYAFDFSVWEIWGALLYGGKLVVVPYLISRSPKEFYNLLAKEKVTVLNQTPTAFQQIINYEDECQELKHLSLRYVIFGGEALNFEILAPWFKRHGDTPQLVNMYGITETTVHVTHQPILAKMTSNQASMIGNRITDLTLYCLDPSQQPVPIGVIGELYVGGEGLARGYLNRPELTEQRFIPNPFATEEDRLHGKNLRLYRTGDLVRYLPDGNLEYLGRCDEQVKIRGFRIELGEMEHLLRQNPSVKDCRVIAIKDNNQKRLVAYVIPSGKDLSEEDQTQISQILRELLKQKLPDYMMPSAIMYINTLPLNPNGKLDRKKLPLPSVKQLSIDKGYVPSQTSFQAKLLSMWEELLNVKPIGITHDFFKLGGHSLLAMRLIAMVRREFKVELSLRTLFEAPTVKALSDSLEKELNLPRKLYLPIERQIRGEKIPLSFGQQRLWFIEQLEPEKALYQVPIVFRIKGELNIIALEKALSALVERHEILRACFKNTQGESSLTITELKTKTLQLKDISNVKENIELGSYLLETIEKTFDLSEGPLFRFTAVRLSDTEHVLALVLHHAITDGWSLGVLTKELSALYNHYAYQAPLALKPLTIQYADYAIWQRGYLSENLLSTDLSYWKEQLVDAPEESIFPTDYPRPKVSSYQGARISATITSEQVAQLNQLAQAQGATLFMVLLASLKTLLYRYTGQDDLVIGTPIAGRTHQELEGLIGFFVNTLALRSKIRADISFTQLLSKIKETIAEAFSYQMVPFEQVVDQVGMERHLGRHPLFQVMLVLQNDEPLALSLQGLVIQPEPISYQKANFDLTFNVSKGQSGELSVEVQYAQDLYSRHNVEQIVNHWKVLIESICQHPKLSIVHLSLLTIKDQKLLLLDWNKTESSYPQDKTIHQLFEEQVVKTPDNIAVVFENVSLTYRQLNERANQLAHYLKASGVKTEDLVGLSLRRSLDLVVGLLGILKAGAAYVPLDPSYPPERIAFMVEDSKVNFLVTESCFEELFTKCPARMIYVDAEKEISHAPAINLSSPSGPHNLAYVIYTSGSTGQPKGVLIEHRGVCNLAQAQAKDFNVTSESRALHFASFSFDAAVSEWAIALTQGASLHLASDQERLDVTLLEDLLVRHKITVATLPPLIFSLLKNTHHLKTIIVAGETPDMESMARWYQNVMIRNAYGPTECTVCVSSIAYDGNNSARTIGRPMANVKVYVLDSSKQPVPIGVIGELYVGGVGLARGYLNRPELTEQRFIHNPFATEEDRLHGKNLKLYRTGDLVRYLPDGNLEYLGRSDEQVKIRGFRIELGEIEHVLRQSPMVKDCRVIAVEGSNQTRLIAYVITPKQIEESEQKQISQMLQELAKQKLPDYMIPSAFMFVELFPLNPNGKLDRNRLPKPLMNISLDFLNVNPQNEIEEKLIEIWSEVLQQSINRNDNFFNRGGDSIQAIRLVSKMKDAGYDIKVKDIFEQKTIENLASVIEKNKEILHPKSLDVGGSLPITPIEHWFFERNFPCVNHFNQGWILQARGKFNPLKLEQALQVIVKHHDILRSRFLYKNDSWHHEVEEHNYSEILETILIEPKPNEDYKLLVQRVVDQKQSSLNIETGKVFKAILIECPVGQFLVIIAHHLVIDGFSWRIIFDDIEKAYKGMPIPPKTNSFKEWSTRLTQFSRSSQVLSDKNYWENLPQIRGIQNDSVIKTQNYKLVHCSLSSDWVEKLFLKAPSAYHTEVNDLLLTALVLTLIPISNDRGLHLWLEGHGREDVFNNIDVSRTVGWFTNLFPIYLEIDSKSIGSAIKQVKEQLRKIPAKGFSYGLLRYLNKETINNFKNRTKPEVLFNYLGSFGGNQKEKAFYEDLNPLDNCVSEKNKDNLRLSINSLIIKNQLNFVWDYNPNFFQETTVGNLASSFLDNLKTIITHCSNMERSEFTISDFPLVNINQDQLSNIEELVKKNGSKLYDIYPLSPMQNGLFFHSKFIQSDEYLVQTIFDLKGDWNTELLKKAWQYVIQQQDILRTGFTYEKVDESIQFVQEAAKLNWEFLDLRNNLNQKKELKDFVESDRKNLFDLSRPPLLRISIIQLNNSCFEMVITAHHIILDGWSQNLLLKEVFKFYSSSLNALAIHNTAIYSYKNYIRWLLKQEKSIALAFWNEYLSGTSSSTRLNLSKIEEPPDHVEHVSSISSNITLSLKNLAQKNNLTLNTIIQAAWSILLSKYTQSEEVVFGNVLSGRHAKYYGVEQTIGLLTSTVPIRVNASISRTVSDLCVELQDSMSKVLNFSYLSLPDIHKAAGFAETFYDTLFIFENIPVEDYPLVTNLKAKPIYGIEKLEFPLTITISPDVGLKFKFLYRKDHFSKEIIENLAENFGNLLYRLPSQFNSKISKIDIISSSQRNRLVFEFNKTSKSFNKCSSLHQSFEEQVARTPDKIAVIFESVSLTYLQLNERANQLAHYLKASGVKTEDLIGVSLRRSLDLVVGLLGILKAGAAYVPLDPSYPPERIAFMLEDSKVNFLVTESCFKELFAKCPARVIYVDTEKEINLAPTINLSSPSGPHNLAYVIYTSGSTGQPKGVMGEHKAILNRLHWYKENFPYKPQEVCGHKTSINFVDSVAEFFNPLLSGIPLVVLSDIATKDITLFTYFLKKNKISRLVVVPSLLNELIINNDETIKALDLIVVSGEALTKSLAIQVLQRFPHVKLLNFYGSSEVTADVCFADLTTGLLRGASPPIGKPIANTTLYVLDNNLQLVPMNVTGELYVGGEGLARGYLNRPDLTEQRFIPNPFATEEDRLHGKNLRLYRTGDSVRYLPDGNLEYLGRCDEQVKIRGFRIELGEIEHVLRQSPMVKDCRVIAIEENNQKRLIAYVIASKQIEESEHKQINQTLQELVRQKLPDYMMPSAFMFIDNLPLNPNGKLDRKKLPLPSVKQLSIDRGYVPSQTSFQAKLLSMWEELLNVKPIGITHDFFKLGGHSLLAMRLIAMVRREFKVELSLRTLFEAPTVKALSDSLEKELNLPRKLYLPIERQIRGEKIPLSFGQQRLWFIEQLEPEKALYQVPIVFRIKGKLNIIALEKAFSALVERHEILRACFKNTQGESSLTITELKTKTLQLKDISNVKENIELGSYLLETIEKTFDLSEGPLFRFTAVRLSDTEHVLALVLHHAITDGWSLGVLTKELSALYNHYSHQTPLALKPLNIQYADYAIWQRGYLSENLLSTDLSYWKEQLVGAPEESIFPTDHPRPKVSSYQGARISATITSEQVAQLNQLAQAQGATLFMVLLASLKTLLYRYTGQEDLVIGTPIAGRTHQELEGLIGFFVNTLALRTKVKNSQTFVQLLSKIKESTLDAFSHQVVPFEEVVDQVSVERHLGRHPLFQVMLVLQNNEPLSFNLQGLQVQLEPINYTKAKFDLTCNALELPNDELRIELEYATDLYEAATINLILQHWQVLLKELCFQPHQSIGKLTILTKAEQKLLLLDWNKTERLYPHEKTIHQLFEEQVVRTPDNIAVVFENVSLTYRQLNERANQLAHYLKASGVKTEDLIGLSLRRSLDLVVGLLGILKAGAAYVPLDPSYPPERIVFMLEDSKVNFLVTESCFKEIFAKCSARMIYVDTDKKITQTPCYNLSNSTNSQNLVYVIYTSGSTGQPKGVMVEHKSVVNTIKDIINKCAIHENDRVLASTSIGFDIAAIEIYAPLIVGAKIFIGNKKYNESISELIEIITKNNITLIQATPSGWQMLLDSDWYPSNEVKILCGGEALSNDLSLRFQHNNKEIINLYGPTETTIWCSFSIIKNMDNINIGRPLANYKFYVLDLDKQLVPLGVVGELYVGGVGLARGYLNRPELTEQRFIPNPFATEEDRLHGKNLRLYRTGDLVRYLPDGNLEYLGRCDEQVKIRGFRIELGEIEHVLRQSPMVKDCRVFAVEENNQKRLIAYVIPPKQIEESEQKQVSQILQELAKQKLPDYMIPSVIMFINKLHLNQNGKLDRKKLPLPNIKHLSLNNNYVASQTSLQAKLVSMWEELLNIKPIGITHDFFKLGGHSLLVMRLIAMVRRQFKVELSPRRLFEATTIIALSDTIEKELKSPKKLFPPIEQQIRPEKIPLSFGQQRLWFIEQLEPEKAVYQVPVVLRFTGILNVDALNKALNALIDRHEILRTHLAEDQGKPYQVIVPSNSVSIDFEIAGNTKLETHFNELIELPFNLTKGPLLRCNVTQLSSDQHVLTLVMHHVTTDGWSLGILAKELSALYNHYAYQAPLALKPLAIQYADYAIWQRRYLSESLLSTGLSYWKEQLVDTPEESTFPADRPRPKVSSYKSNCDSTTISKEQVAQLQQLANSQSTTLFMVLLASLKTLLYRYTGQEDLVIGTPIAGRTHQELEGLIGFFVNTLALRTKVKTNQTFIQLLGKVKESTLEAFSHQVVPFEQVVDQVGVRRHLGRHPLFQVMLVLQNNEPVTFNLQGLDVQHESISYRKAKFDLTFNIYELPSGELRIELEYATDLYEAATIKQILQHWQVLLGELCNHPNQSIGKLTLLTKADQKLLLLDWTKTESPYPQDKTIHQLFEEQVVKTPDNIAVVFENVSLTYCQLNERANQLAHYLKASGVKTEDLIGLSLRRSLDLVVGLLGILKAGAAYVPLDPSYPPERIAFMLEYSKVNFLVTESCFKEMFAKCSARMIYVDTEKEISLAPTINLSSPSGPHNLAYVIYTSGSTGQPKGVLIEHRGVCNLAQAQAKDFNVTSESRALHFASFSFDAAVSEWAIALTQGARLHLASDQERLDVTLLEDLLVRHQITVATLPPLIFSLLKNTHHLKTIVVAGETPDMESMGRWYQKVMIRNAYGPTECTVCVSSIAYDGNYSARTIGRPMANVKVYVLDSSKQPVPIGVIGELYVGGVGLARGYLNRPELTEQRFLPNPFATEEDRLHATNLRLYRTGDLVRYLPDGNLEYLGRCDEQVKIRGFRIELGEIEHVLRQSSIVKDCRVIAIEENNQKRLIAYVIASTQTEESEQKKISQTLQELAKQKLPDYMLPSAFMFMDHFPLNTNGKLDYKKLSKEGFKHYTVDHQTTPCSSLELQLIRIFEEVLNIKGLKIETNFFSVGGTSILALKLVSRIYECFRLKLSIVKFMQGPTVKQIIDNLDIGMKDQSDGFMTFKKESIGTPLILIHPGNGLTFCYLGLASNLTCPIYAINNPKFNDRENTYDSFEAMAKDYIWLIKKYLPKGPYRLGGFSSGGIIALNIASQLTQSGDTIEDLILIDTIFNNNKFEEEKTPSFENQIVEAIKLEGISLNSSLAEAIRFELSNTHKLMKIYSPPKYLGSVTLLKAREIEDNSLDFIRKKLYNNLDSFCPNIKVLSIPGCHRYLFSIQNMRTTIDGLKTALECCEWMKNLNDLHTSNIDRQLIFSAKYQDANTINLLLSYNRNNLNINIQDNEGYTALHWAVINNDKNIIHLLLQAGAKKDLITKKGSTPGKLALDLKFYELASVINDFNFKATTLFFANTLTVTANIEHDASDMSQSKKI